MPLAPDDQNLLLALIDAALERERIVLQIIERQGGDPASKRAAVQSHHVTKRYKDLRRHVVAWLKEE